MNQLEKLQVLLPHWIEHNRGHAEECQKWTDLIAENSEAAEDVRAHLCAAFLAMETVGDCLEKALAAAGGAKKESGAPHHHHHH